MDQQRAIELAEQGHNIFLTGNAGTGKTYTLNKIIEKFREQGKHVAVTASTGIASTHLNGSTIHSWSRIGIKKQLIIDDLYQIKNHPKTRARIKSADVLIIDEISMFPDYCFDMVDEVCKFVRDNNKPFGGLQVITCGDFFQLPPVNPNSNKKHYCFQAEAWNNSEMKTCYLQKIYRQENDRVFIDILNNIRRNNVTPEQMVVLNELKNNQINMEKAINLFCTNNDVDYLNINELKKIEGESKISEMIEEGDLSKLEILKKHCLAAARLELKLGAKVMIIVNDFKQQQYVNGTLGEIIDISQMHKFDGRIGIRIFKNDNIVFVERNTWKIEEYDERQGRDVVIASINQYPIKLAWAITVHKSQGATFDYVNMDLIKTFEKNQGYVAFSRATTLSGIFLVGYNMRALQVDPFIVNHDDVFLRQSKENE